MGLRTLAAGLGAAERGDGTFSGSVISDIITMEIEAVNGEQGLEYLMFGVISLKLLFTFYLFT